MMKGCQAASLLPSIPAKAEVTYPCWNMKDRAGHTEEGYQENLSSNNTFSFSPSYFTPNRSLLRPSLCPARCWARGYTVSQANWPCPPGAHSPWTKGSLTGSLRTFFPRKVLPSFSKAVKSKLFPLCKNDLETLSLKVISTIWEDTLALSAC